MKKQLLLLIMMLLPVTAMADSVEIDGMYYNLNSNDKTAEVIENPNKYAGSVVIPESVAYGGSDYRITCIKNHAFYKCTDLTSITIPKSVSKIENSAFQGCSALKKVIIDDIKSWCSVDFENAYSNPLQLAHHIFSDENTEVQELSIPNSVINIGARAFASCTGLTLINIPNTVTSIGNSAFQGCTGLTSVAIPSSVTSIGNGAFNYCENLASVHIADLENWCKISFTGDAFDSNGHFLYINGNKIEDLVIPNSITSIGDCAFSYCYGFKSVTIPNSVTSIGNSAFKSTGLISVTIPNSVTSLGYYAFRDCRALTSVKIGDSVISIGDGAFQNCTGLTTVDIPNSVTSIGDGAFSGCTGLTSVTIPNSVTYIGDGAFSGCTCFSVENGIRYVGPYLLEVEDKDQSSYIIKDGTRTIGSSAFGGCNNFTSVTIPNSVTYIGWQAFSCCI